jgi:hypothetical protein
MPRPNETPLFLLAHGAGAPSASAWMQAWARRLCTLGDVEAFDYPYMLAGRKAPDKLPALIAAHREALAAARARHGARRRFVLAGKSMGSRVGCHLAVELHAAGDPPAANLCFGYPLRAGSSGALRDQVLLALRTPVLFVQGSKDPLCNVAELDGVRARMTAPSVLFVVDGGNHSLEVGARDRKAQGKSQEQWDADVLTAVAGFLGMAP